MDVKKYIEIRPLKKVEQMFDLSNKVGVIIGGAGKMGQAFAGSLVHAGAMILIADHNADLCGEAVINIENDIGKKVKSFVCNVANQDEVKALFDSVSKEFGRLDFLINNAMSKPEGYYQPFQDYSLDTWKEVMDTNLAGAFMSCQAAIPLMRQTGGGSIVITASTYGVVSPDQRIYKDCKRGKNLYGGSFSLNAPGVYSASKGGLIAFSRYLATLLAPENIRVNVLTPGGVYDGQEESFHKAYIERTPLGRMATWTDYNGAILFLVSDASRYMTGSNLIVDGGWTAW